MPGRSKGPDEIFCRSCGAAIKKEAAICPDCGVRNKASTGSSAKTGKASNGTSTGPAKSSTGNEHDPTRIETTVSDTWWHGVIAGILLWISVLVLTTLFEDSGGAVVGFLALVSWIGLPTAAYFDMEYVRANSKWNPNTGFWMVALAVWIVNIVVGIVYLYRRHEVLGTP